MCIKMMYNKKNKMMYNITTFKNVFQYQTAKFSSVKPQVLLQQPHRMEKWLFKFPSVMDFDIILQYIS